MSFSERGVPSFHKGAQQDAIHKIERARGVRDRAVLLIDEIDALLLPIQKVPIGIQRDKTTQVFPRSPEPKGPPRAA